MKLIRKLPPKLNKTNHLQSWGEFYCEVCKKYVEKLLFSGYKANSCGSLNCKDNKNNYKHGESNTKLYQMWCNMKDRCYNKNRKQYKDYGGRGIIVCDEWLNSFVIFKKWAIKNDYIEGLQIDRKENNKGYFPDNCHFVTKTINMRNSRATKLTLEEANEIRYLHNTGEYTPKELAEKYNINSATIYRILKNKIWR